MSTVIRTAARSLTRTMPRSSNAQVVPSKATAGATMKVNKSKDLKKGTRVYWRGDAADSGIITETSWDAVTITWAMGRWPACTMGTCAKFSEWRQTRIVQRQP
jgi:hypothetical protein